MKLDQEPKLLRTIAIVAAVYLAFAWLIDDKYYQLILTIVPIWAMMGIAWNVFSGYSGLVSFGHAAFFGIGAYTVALAMIEDGASRHGETLEFEHFGTVHRGTLVAPCFYDPSGARLNV